MTRPQDSPPRPITVYLGLGSNLGDRRWTIEEAVRRLSAPAGALADVAMSPLYETDPVADEPQPDYLNAVLRGRTVLAAEALLALCLRIETELGRVRPGGGSAPAGAAAAGGARHKASRTLDIDLLLFGDRVIDAPGLIVPHPALLERAFVRIPLADVAEPGLQHPLARVPLTTARPSPGVRRALTG